MDPVDLELAAEFCKLVGAPNLLFYLGMDDDGPSADAIARLKARRKFMQGMQGNPKYKREALFLIKHFGNLTAVLGDVPAYVRDAQGRAESEHLPVVEMTVRGVLAGGGVTDDQVDYLRRNAAELGVSEPTFLELLDRVATELEVALPEGVAAVLRPPTAEEPKQLPPSMVGTYIPPDDIQLDLYQLLDIASTANEDDVRLAYVRRLDELDQMTDSVMRDALRRRLEIARQVLSNEATRRHYDLTAARTGPPARARDTSPTAPPVKERGTGARLEILGEPVRTLWLTSGITVATITIRNGGEGAMPGAVAADVPWMAIDPKRLDPTAVEQRISVQVDRADVPDGAGAAVVTILTERGERARVVFEIRRSAALWVAGAVAAALLGVMLSLLYLIVRWL